MQKYRLNNKITICTYSAKLKHAPFISCLMRYLELIKNPRRIPMGLWGWKIIWIRIPTAALIIGEQLPGPERSRRGLQNIFTRNIS